MNEIELPMLRGDEPSTFLAALGVLSLLTVELGAGETTLSWPGTEREPAVVSTSAATDLEELVAKLEAIARAMAESDELLPGEGQNFPPRKEGKTGDPSRSVSVGEGLSWAKNDRLAASRSRTWLSAMFATNDAVRSETASPKMGRNPVFDAGPGTVSMSTTLATGRKAAATAGALGQSLSVGNRRGGEIGGYLDWRADRDGAAAGGKRDDTTNYGDPSMAWLGFMGLRVAPLVAINDRVASGLCRPGRIDGFRKPLVWPVWSEPISFDAIVALIAHPAISPQRFQSTDLDWVDRNCRSLGLHAVLGASRLSKGNNDGAYGPAVRLWPRRS